MVTQIKKYDFKTGIPVEFEIISMKQLFDDNKELLTSIHRTGFYHILWFQSGTATHLVDFKLVDIQPNTLLFLNKDIIHRFDKSGNFDGQVILFTESFFCKTEADTKFLRNNILFNDLFTISKIHFDETPKTLINLLQLLSTEFNNENDSFQSAILKNNLHNFLLLSERERRKQNFVEIKKGANLDYVMHFKELLENNFKMQKQVNYFAKQINITEKRLNQATSTILNKTPKEIIDNRIMLEAKRLLVHTSFSVKEVGFTLGFEEPTNFIKYFKKHIHITPVEFREKSRLA